MFLTEKNFKYYHTGGHFLESTKISASEDLNALEKPPSQFMTLSRKGEVQIMPLQILSGKGEVQIMLFRKLSGKCHFLLWFCTRNWSETYIMTTCVWWFNYGMIVTITWNITHLSYVTLSSVLALSSVSPTENKSHTYHQEKQVYHQGKHLYEKCVIIFWS